MRSTEIKITMFLTTRLLTVKHIKLNVGSSSHGVPQQIKSKQEGDS